MSSNKFAKLVSLIEDSDNDSEVSVSDLPDTFDGDFEESKEIAQGDNSNGNDNYQSRPLTIRLLREMNASFGDQCMLCQVSQVEAQEITRAKSYLLKTLKSALRTKVLEKGFRQVYKSTSIFHLLSGLPVNNYFKTVANGHEDDYQGMDFVLKQYKYYGKTVNIVGISYFGSCSFCDPDLDLEYQISKIEDPEAILKVLEEDLVEKFNSLKFFTEFQDAANYLKAKTPRVKIKWATTEKALENRKIRLEKVRQETEWKKRFPGQAVPSGSTLADFLPASIRR